MWQSPNKTTWQTTAGFTLWEVMIALTVLIIGILSLARLFPLALQVSKAAEQSTVAMNLAQAKIEEILYLGYDGANIGTVEPRTRLATNKNNPFYYFERETNVTYVNGTDLSNSAVDTGIKKVIVTMYWKSPLFSMSKQRDLIILISRK